MNPERKDDRLKSVPEDDEEQPEVYGVVKQEGGFALDRRTFLGGLAAGALVSASGSGASSEQPTKKPKSLPLKAEAKPRREVKGDACTKLKGHSEYIDSIAFSPNGKLLASASDDNTTKLWAVSEGKLLTTLGHSEAVGPLKAVSRVTFSADGKLLASRSADGAIKLWALPEGKLLSTLSVPSGYIALSPNGKLLASGSYNTIKLWALPEGRLLTTLSGHANGVGAVAFSPDGKLLASGSSDHTTKLWALPEGSLLTTLSGHANGVHAVAFSPDGKLLASGSSDNTIKLWALPEGRLLTTLSGHANGVSAVDFSPDSRLLASGSDDNTIKLWALPEGKLLTTLSEDSVVRSVAISPDGKLLASCSTDTIRLWVLPEGEPNRCLWDPAITERGTQVKTYRQMGTETLIIPCGNPIPPGATCICDCVAGTINYRGKETVCICDMITVSASTAIPAGVVCTCNTIAVGTYSVPTHTPAPAPFPSGTGIGGHYWYPN